jgi:hypothetical protein
MIRKLIRTDGTMEDTEVGNGFADWNKAIGARVGEIVPTDHGKELWCDEEALCVGEPEINTVASALVSHLRMGQPIFGDVIVFEEGDIT